jgi:hypothetical protein
VAEPAAGGSLSDHVSGRDPGAPELGAGRQRTGLRFLASYTLAKAIDNTSGGDEFHFSTILGNQLEKTG